MISASDRLRCWGLTAAPDGRVTLEPPYCHMSVALACFGRSLNTLYPSNARYYRHSMCRCRSQDLIDPLPGLPASPSDSKPAARGRLPVALHEQLLMIFSNPSSSAITLTSLVCRAAQSAKIGLAARSHTEVAPPPQTGMSQYCSPQCLFFLIHELFHFQCCRRNETRATT